MVLLPPHKPAETVPLISAQVKQLVVEKGFIDAGGFEEKIWSSSAR